MTSEQTGLKWYGKPVEEMTREELIAALYDLARYSNRQHEAHRETIRFLQDIDRIKRGWRTWKP